MSEETAVGTIIKRFELIINFITLVIVAIIAYAGWATANGIASFFRSETDFESYVWTTIEGAAENDQLVTGLSAVDMLWLQFDEQWYSLAEVLERDIPETLDQAIYSNPPSRPEDLDIEYCAHSYELVIGYPSFSDLRSKLESGLTADPGGPIALEAPSILALNIVNTRVNPPQRTDACMARNLVGSARQDTERDLWRILEHDGIRDMHIKQGQLAAVTLLDSIAGGCREPLLSGDRAVAATSDASSGNNPPTCWRDKLITQWESAAEEGPEQPEDDEFALSIFSMPDSDRRAEQLAIAADAAGLGAIQVTISTLFGMDTSWRPWFWFDRDGVYLQRDVSRIVYGSPVTPIAALEPRRILGETVTRLVLRRPTELSRDRQTSFVLQTGRDRVWENAAQNAGGNLASYVTLQINDAVSIAERGIRERAVIAAESLIRQRMLNWSDGRVSVEFGAGDSAQTGVPLGRIPAITEQR